MSHVELKVVLALLGFRYCVSGEELNCVSVCASTVAAGGEEGAVHFWDCRNPSKRVAVFEDVHATGVTKVSSLNSIKAKLWMNTMFGL